MDVPWDLDEPLAKASQWQLTSMTLERLARCRATWLDVHTLLGTGESVPMLPNRNAAASPNKPQLKKRGSFNKAPQFGVTGEFINVIA